MTNFLCGQQRQSQQIIQQVMSSIKILPVTVPSIMQPMTKALANWSLKVQQRSLIGLRCLSSLATFMTITERQQIPVLLSSRFQIISRIITQMALTISIISSVAINHLTMLVLRRITQRYLVFRVILPRSPVQQNRPISTLKLGGKAGLGLVTILETQPQQGIAA